MNLLEKALRKIEYFFKVSWNRILTIIENIENIKWYIERKIVKICKYAETYFKQVSYYIRTGKAKADKILSFHQEDVVCITKKKEEKEYFFGRRWQIVRLENNFCFGIFSEDLKLNDSIMFPLALEILLTKLGFIPRSVGADCGYWSDENIKVCFDANIETIAIQPKGRKKHLIKDMDKREACYNHRSGIEPVIGHLKQKGLGQSKMKTDKGTLMEGLRSFIAFNLKKLISLV